MMWLLLICILLLAIVMAGCWYLSGVVAFPKLHTLESAKKIEMERGNYGDFDALDKTDYLIPMPDGYVLHAVFIPAATPTDRYVIITHGYGYNRIGSVKYVHLFRKLGCHCIIYDNRGHGENPRTHVTMGKQEHLDLLAVIEDTRRRYGADIRIGLHGESMGSATSVLALGKHPQVDFLVSDCGYAELPLLLKDLLGKQYHLPGFLVYPASLISRLRFGFSYGEVMPRQALAGNKVPVLFIHGSADDFILPEHAHIFHSYAECRKELLLVDGAKHADSLATDREGYEAAVRQFVSGVWTDVA